MKNKKNSAHTEHIPQDIGWGCCAGSCLGLLLRYAFFVGTMIYFRRHALPVPYTDTDAFFVVVSGVAIGGVIGAIINPIFRGYIRNKRKSELPNSTSQIPPSEK